MSLRQWARNLKRDVLALWIAARDPRTPWAVRLVAMAVAAYALSPIDLIPDFIPILGYLDDLILVPVGVLAVRRMIPPEVLVDCRHRASSAVAAGPRTSWTAGAVIVALWLGAGIALAAWWLRSR